MAFTPQVINKELDMANLAKHNANYAGIKTELDSQASAVSAHTGADTAHGSTSEASAGKIIQRDANGRAKVAAPEASEDIARKAEVDTIQSSLDSHAADEDIHLSVEDRTKLGEIEPNQNAFSTINGIAATSETDSITFKGGTGITVTQSPVTKEVSITATGDATPGAHALSHVDGADQIPDAVTNGASGLMSGADARFVREDGETKTGAQAKADAAQTAAEQSALSSMGELTNLETSNKDDLVSAINEVFISVGNGKTLIADAITDKGVPTSATDTFGQMAENIVEIKSGGTVKGVQRGQYNFNSASTTSAKIPISSIVTENSIVTITVQSSGTEARNSMIMAEITSATELTLSRFTGHNNTDFVWWEVIEYESVKSLQKFTGEVPTTSLSIFPVDPTKAIVFGSRKTNSTLASIGSVVRSKYYLRNGNVVEVTPVLSSTIETYHIQVVEFD